jgi:mRNA-degrading endonuclease toxin of MazEF toxin-antitoxin module
MKWSLYSAVMLLFVSCSKKSGSESDNQLPVVTLSSPTNNQVFTAGQTVNITGTLTDNKRVAEVHVHISNHDTGDLLVDIHRNPGTASYTLNETFTVQSGIHYRIQVIAKDNSANEGRATVEVSAN